MPIFRAENLQHALQAANALKLYGEQYAWFAGTKDEEASFDATCCNDMKVGRDGPSKRIFCGNNDFVPR